jgi:hypothetical protein
MHIASVDVQFAEIKKNCAMLTIAKMKYPLLNMSTKKYHEYTEHLII